MQSSQKIWDLLHTRFAFRDQSSNYAPPFGDLNLFTLSQKAFYLLESVTEFPNRSIFHVIHISITSRNLQPPLFRWGQVARAAARHLNMRFKGNELQEPERLARQSLNQTRANTTRESSFDSSLARGKLSP